MAKKKKTPPKRKAASKKTPSRRPSSPKGNDTRPPKASKAPTSATKGKATAKADRQATQPKKAAHGKAPAKPKRTSLLEAATRVLKETRKTMRSGDIVEVILKKDYWQTTGKTPSATLHAAMIREIKDKGQKARFKKVDRGLFGLNHKS